jgi:hypothetical protein
MLLHYLFFLIFYMFTTQVGHVEPGEPSLQDLPESQQVASVQTVD